MESGAFVQLPPPLEPAAVMEPRFRSYTAGPRAGVLSDLGPASPLVQVH